MGIDLQSCIKMVKNNLNKHKNESRINVKKGRTKEGRLKETDSKSKHHKDSKRNKDHNKPSVRFEDEERDKDDDKLETKQSEDNSDKELPEKSPNNENETHLEFYDTNDSSVVFIGNVPLTIKTKSDLIKKLKLDPRIIQSVHFRSLPVHPKYSHNKKLGIIKKKFSNVKDNQNAYVKLTDVKYKDELIKKNTMEVDGHHLFINTNNKDEFSKFSRKKTIFVGRLSPSTTEDDLYNVFMNISPVKGVRIVRDPTTMKSRGFGFVAFDNRMAVVEAIKEFNNTQFKGYTLNVTKCLDEKESMEKNRALKGGNKKSSKFDRKKSRK